MPILSDASKEELTRLLNLFPAAQLKATWGNVEAAIKHALCKGIASKETLRLAGAYASFKEPSAREILWSCWLADPP